MTEAARDGVGDVRVEAEGELALARLALDDGEMEHCASHLGNAIAEDPTLPAVYELLDELAARGTGPELFPRTGHDHAGAIAARAHLAARAGDYAEALSCLGMLAAFEPTKAWTSGGWLDRPEVAAGVDPQTALRAIVSITGKLGDELPAEVVRMLTPFLAFTRRLIAAHPDAVDILPMLSGLPRRMGEIDEAIAWCERAEAAAPSVLSAVMLGNALRRAGRTEETLRVWRRGLDRDPSNVALHVDIAEEIDRQGGLAEALEWLDRALAIDPADETAFPSACEMRFRATGDVAHLIALMDHWRLHPDHSYANDRLSKVCDGRVWLDHPPHPTEAISNGATQLYGREGDDDPAAMQGELALSALEVPSAVAAFSMALPRIQISVQAVPAPDLRVRFAPGDVELWRYEGTTPHPAVAPPSAAAVEALHGLATGGWWHPRQAYEQAIGLSVVPVADLLGLLAHPVPAPPAWRDFHRRDPVVWPRVAQVWACLGLLHHGGETPWADSARRAVLRDIAFGIEDWTTDAALFAMVVAAWLDPAARADVVAAVASRFTALAAAYREREVTIAKPVAELVLITPEMWEGVRELARSVLGSDRQDAS